MSEFPNVAGAASRRAAGDDLPFDDERDFEAARRGFVVGLAEPQVRAADGRLVWDAGSYGFLEGDNPGTVSQPLAAERARCPGRPL